MSNQDHWDRLATRLAHPKFTAEQLRSELPIMPPERWLIGDSCWYLNSVSNWLSVDGVAYPAHRVLYDHLIHPLEPSPRNLLVRHSTCHQSCINPFHYTLKVTEAA